MRPDRGSFLRPASARSGSALIIESPAAEKAAGGVLGFLVRIIPANPFEALSTNQAMSIVFLSVCLGLALGRMKGDWAQPALSLFETIYEAFMQPFRWAVVPLAPGFFR